ncbi:MAG: hypothetical protein QW286_02735, partial [Candidatus Aenigmatarchaeota archaeon]
MPKVKNLFSDYNGTLDPRYLEIALAYELLNYHKEQGNKMRYIDLLANRQARLLFGFLAGGKQKLIEPYVNGFLSGEEKTVIDSAARRLSKRDTKMPAVVKRLIGEEKIFGKPYPEAKQLFNKAKEIGIKTGIYTRSLLDIIMPALNDEGLLCYFDYVVGNKISYKNSIV